MTGRVRSSRAAISGWWIAFVNGPISCGSSTATAIHGIRGEDRSMESVNDVHDRRWVDDDTIAFRFHARDAHLVLSRGAQEPIPFRMLLDGKPPSPSHGVDVDDQGNGVLGDGRMYQLVRQRDTVRDRTLQITFLEPGAEA
jgi:hypothetical protein